MYEYFIASIFCYFIRPNFPFYHPFLHVYCWILQAFSNRGIHRGLLSKLTQVWYARHLVKEFELTWQSISYSLVLSNKLRNIYNWTHRSIEPITYNPFGTKRYCNVANRRDGRFPRRIIKSSYSVTALLWGKWSSSIGILKRKWNTRMGTNIAS